MTYHREVREGDPLRFTTRLLGHDAKRIHYIHEMFHADEGYLAATNELMSLHVSQATRRGAPMAAGHPSAPRPRSRPCTTRCRSLPQVGPRDGPRRADHE